MVRAEIIAVGRLKKGHLFDIYEEYSKRITPSPLLKEIEAKSSSDEETSILASIDKSSYVFAMDEHGIGLSSKEFAGKLENLAIQGKSKVQFIIGGADGLPQSVRDRANFILSFGKQTWPHMLARVMLTEQIYRAQQIIAGHPYHRE